MEPHVPNGAWPYIVGVLAVGWFSAAKDGRWLALYAGGSILAIGIVSLPDGAPFAPACYKILAGMILLAVGFYRRRQWIKAQRALFDASISN